MPSLFVRFLPDTLPDKFDRSTNRVELTTELKDDSGSGSVLVRILRVVVLNVEAELFQQVVKRVLPFAVFTGKAKRNSVGEISDVLTVFENSIAERMIAIRTREMLLVLFNGEISQVISDHYKECEFTSYLGQLSAVPPTPVGFRGTWRSEIEHTRPRRLIPQGNPLWDVVRMRGRHYVFSASIECRPTAGLGSWWNRTGHAGGTTESSDGWTRDPSELVCRFCSVSFENHQR